jgi:hypothetical protein
MREVAMNKMLKEEAVMEAQTRCHENVRRLPNEISRTELLEIVGSLRQEVQSVSSDIRVVLKENKKLKDEVERLQGRGQDGQRFSDEGEQRFPDEGEQRFSDARRVRRELEELMRMHEAASGRGKRRQATRSEATRSGATRSGPSNGDQSSDKGAWMKKMMMFMMISELV